MIKRLKHGRIEFFEDCDSIFMYELRLKIAIYGLGTETRRFIEEKEKQSDIVGLLDGFRESGEMYGYPIISLPEVLSLGVNLIIVVARPGSCKVIAKRIGAFCIENHISLYDVRGKNLLEKVDVIYDFEGFSGYTRDELCERIKDADVISFDLFDTLLTRYIYSYTDLFELINMRLHNDKNVITDFVEYRIKIEKELSRNGAPRLSEIYDALIWGKNISGISSNELCEIEYELDLSTIIPRRDMCEVLDDCISMGKSVVITSDSYYSKEQICHILNKIGIEGIEDVFVSCEYGKSKSQGLFEELKNQYPSTRILHIGDDMYADIESTSRYGVESFHEYSGAAEPPFRKYEYRKSGIAYRQCFSCCTSLLA